MRPKLLEVLACPKCLADLVCTTERVDADGDIIHGSLQCAACGKGFPIDAGIPRFVETDNYATSFGYQWNRFRLEQIDSHNGTRFSTERFYSETEWTKEWLKGKWILDAGCGAGRFVDVASQTEADVVGLDISNAVDAARANVAGRNNVHFVQANIYELPFRTGIFDGAYCIGVVQHTPDPQKSVRTLPRILKPGGRIAITAYERKFWTPLYGKYLVRPLTKRLRKETLLAAIQRLMPVAFPLTNFLFRLPLAGNFFKFVIPVANYVHLSGLTKQQRYDWAILDTFDMLSPQYDQSQTSAGIVGALTNAGIVDIRRLPNQGLNVVGVKSA